MEKKKSFVGGALILGAAGIFVKIMGAVFRIPLGNWLGGGGLACYQAVYPIYTILLTLATAGIPVAISRMVSERIVVNDYRAAHDVYKASFKLLAGIGIVSAVICFFGADIIMKLFNFEKAAPALRTLTPALLIIPIMSAMRGYFQGMQNMRPTAISQFFEQFFRVVVGLGLTLYILKNFDNNLEMAAAGATFGASAGAIAGLIVVYFIYRLNSKTIHRRVEAGVSKLQENTSEIIKKILIIAIPITLGACIMPLMNLIDTKIVMHRLISIGYSQQSAEIMYEQLSGYAGTLINFPQIIIQSVAISLVPAISMSFKTKNGKELRGNIQMGLRLSMMIAFPCAAGLAILSEPILSLLYAGKLSIAVGASGCLRILSFAVIFLAIAQTLTGVLQGVGKQTVPVVNLFIGAVFKTIFTYILVGFSALNVNGAAIGTAIAYIIAATLDLMAVRRITKTKFDIGLTYVKPIISTIVMSVVTFASYYLTVKVLGNTLAVLISIILSGVVYAVMLFVTRSITQEELTAIPGGDKIVKVLNKIKR